MTEYDATNALSLQARALNSPFLNGGIAVHHEGDTYIEVSTRLPEDGTPDNDGPMVICSASLAGEA